MIFSLFFRPNLKTTIQNDILARKLSFHQGCLHYASNQNGGMDGKCGKSHFQNNGRQSLHLSRVQTGTRQFPCKKKCFSRFYGKVGSRCHISFGNFSISVEKLPTLILQALCKDLERAEVKKWLQQILEILMAERGKEERSEQISKLDAIIKKHEELIPTVLKTQVFLYPCDKSK